MEIGFVFWRSSVCLFEIRGFMLPIRLPLCEPGKVEGGFQVKQSPHCCGVIDTRFLVIIVHAMISPLLYVTVRFVPLLPFIAIRAVLAVLAALGALGPVTILDLMEEAKA